MNLTNLLYLILHCFGYKSKESRTGTILHPLALQQICRGRQFEYLAHPLGPSFYVLCLQANGIELACPYGSCFSKEDAHYPCSRTCISDTPMDPEISDQCRLYSTTPLERIPHPKDCDSYFLCVDKNVDPMLLKCPPNQRYSLEHKTCVTKTKDKCSLISEWCRQQNDGQRFVHYNCFQYYECTNNIIKTLTCPYAHHFDRTSNQCVAGFCKDERKPDCLNHENNEKFIHPKCNMYYYCYEQNTMESKCYKGFFYSHQALSCERDNNGVCSLSNED